VSSVPGKSERVTRSSGARKPGRSALAHVGDIDALVFVAYSPGVGSNASGRSDRGPQPTEHIGVVTPSDATEPPR